MESTVLGSWQLQLSPPPPTQSPSSSHRAGPQS